MTMSKLCISLIPLIMIGQAARNLETKVMENVEKYNKAGTPITLHTGIFLPIRFEKCLPLPAHFNDFQDRMEFHNQWNVEDQSFRSIIAYEAEVKGVTYRLERLCRLVNDNNEWEWHPTKQWSLVANNVILSKYAIDELEKGGVDVEYLRVKHSAGEETLDYRFIIDGKNFMTKIYVRDDYMCFSKVGDYTRPWKVTVGQGELTEFSIDFWHDRHFKRTHPSAKPRVAADFEEVYYPHRPVSGKRVPRENDIEVQEEAYMLRQLIEDGIVKGYRNRTPPKSDDEDNEGESSEQSRAEGEPEDTKVTYLEAAKGTPGNGVQSAPVVPGVTEL